MELDLPNPYDINEEASLDYTFFKTNGSGLVWIRNMIIIRKMCPKSLFFERCGHTFYLIAFYLFLFAYT